MQKFIPSEHMVMVWISAALMVLAGVAYYASPPNKSEAFLAIMTMAGGFIFGKFTNGYRRSNTDGSDAGFNPSAPVPEHRQP